MRHHHHSRPDYLNFWTMMQNLLVQTQTSFRSFRSLCTFPITRAKTSFSAEWLDIGAKVTDDISDQAVLTVVYAVGVRAFATLIARFAAKSGRGVAGALLIRARTFDRQLVADVATDLEAKDDFQARGLTDRVQRRIRAFIIAATTASLVANIVLHRIVVIDACWLE